MAKQLRFGNAILCEHVAPGERNKHTLINVYSGDVLVDSIPAKLLFGIYLEHIPDSARPDLTFEIKIDDNIIAKMSVNSKDAEPGSPTAIIVPVFQINIDRDTILQVLASAPGYASRVVIKKRIFKGHLPSPSISSPPPS